MFDFFYEILQASEYAGIFFLIFVFPNEAVMPGVGFAAARGELSLPVAVAVGIAGTTVSSMTLFGIFRFIGRATSRKLLKNYGKLLGSTSEDIRKARRLFNRHAKAAVFVSRFLPGLRSAIGVVAGLSGMPPRTFLLYSVLGSAVDVSILAVLGYSAGTYYEELQAILGNFVAWSGAIVLAAALLVLLFIRRSRK